MEWSDLRSTFTGDLSQIQPLHDYVIVRYLGSANERASSIILDPGNMKLTGDGRLLHNRSTGNRKGVVVACGKGDRLLDLVCDKCGDRVKRVETAKNLACRKCEGSLTLWEGYWPLPRHADMHVQPGDIVIYPQIPVNDFTVGDDLYTFCHEEQHLLAVIEEEVAA